MLAGLVLEPRHGERGDLRLKLFAGDVVGRGSCGRSGCWPAGAILDEGRLHGRAELRVLLLQLPHGRVAPLGRLDLALAGGIAPDRCDFFGCPLGLLLELAVEAPDVAFRVP